MTKKKRGRVDPPTVCMGVKAGGSPCTNTQHLVRGHCRGCRSVVDRIRKQLGLTWDQLADKGLCLHSRRGQRRREHPMMIAARKAIRKPHKKRRRPARSRG